MDTADANVKAASVDEMPVPKIKHEWYQTDTHVIVTVFARKMENAKVSYGENTLSVSANLPSGNEYSLELDLAHPIVPEQCSHKVLPSKLEIKMVKLDGYRWLELEGHPAERDKVKPIPNEILQPSENPHGYPSSSKKHKDWNKIEKEIEKQEAEEMPEGEAAVNALFQKIYGNGSDDVRRAMNKSFIESGGTVLSTNWNEVGEKPVERKPPTGMEWKSWNSSARGN